MLEINSEQDFDRSVLQADGVVFALFTATWCPYCRIQEPRLKELEGKLHFTFAAVDVDKAVGVDDRYDVQTIPSLLVFKDGNQLARQMIAYLQPTELEVFVQSNLNK